MYVLSYSSDVKPRITVMRDVTRFISQIVNDPSPSTYTSKPVMQMKEWEDASDSRDSISDLEPFFDALEKELHSVPEDSFQREAINRCIVNIVTLSLPVDEC